MWTFWAHRKPLNRNLRLNKVPGSSGPLGFEQLGSRNLCLCGSSSSTSDHGKPASRAVVLEAAPQDRQRLKFAHLVFLPIWFKGGRGEGRSCVLVFISLLSKRLPFHMFSDYILLFEKHFFKSFHILVLGTK